MSYYVYILASRRHGALHVDVAQDLERRGCPRREKAQLGFRGGGAPRVVYYEEFRTVLGALAREKQIRACSRKWKIERIEYTNPGWRDLSASSAPLLLTRPAAVPPLENRARPRSEPLS